jgi:2-keto-4-pentenoate hydratase/2-oxohepta-3-ene-1,7-dioic acid hydratase in catechol pathway
MRFVFFDDFKPGVLQDNQVFDISSLFEPADLHSPRAIVSSFIARYPGLKSDVAGVTAKGSGQQLSSVRLRAPVPDPPQLLCAIVNYHEEGREPQAADFFLKSNLSIVGPGDTVAYPRSDAKVFHHEPELAVVIGRAGQNVPGSRAMDYVFGYTGFIDVSARGVGQAFYQMKSPATFGPMGPALVTADEIPDPHDLGIKLWVNETLKHDFNTSQMNNRIDSLVELTAATSGIAPGDVISTGTHHVGLGPVQHGDNVVMEIERVGRLSIKVEDPLRREWDRNAPNAGRGGPIRQGS